MERNRKKQDEEFNAAIKATGKGFYVCEYNSDYLKEKQYIELEKRLTELLEDCEKAGMKKKEIMDLVDTLLG